MLVVNLLLFLRNIFSVKRNPSGLQEMPGGNELHLFRKQKELITCPVVEEPIGMAGTYIFQQQREMLK